MKKVIIFLFMLFVGFACNNQTKDTLTEDTSSTEKPTVESLEQFFSEEKSGGRTWVQVKDALSAEQMGFYIYFRKDGKTAKGLRMRIQYGNHDIYQFSVDGEKYTYKANKLKSADSKYVGGGGLNWYDYEVTYKDLKFLRALVASKSARIVFSNGTTAFINDEMRTDIQNTLDYFEALGGQLPVLSITN